MQDRTGREIFEEALKQYGTSFSEEKLFRERFLTLLEAPDAFQRTHLPGHITGSAFIVSEDLQSTLLVHHAKLKRWLQPGGHADGDTDVVRVANREANEETGLIHLKLVTSGIFDLDIHPIPERKDFPAHDHYDVRYLFLGSMNEKVVVSKESLDVKWIPLAALEKYNGEKSILRLRDKLSGL